MRFRPGIWGVSAGTRRRCGARLRAAVCALALLCTPLLAMAQTPQPAATPVPAALPDPADEAWLDQILARMGTADKVGQLFLISFFGDATDDEAAADIAYLVQVLRTGGVILSPENENYQDEDSAPQQVLSLTRALQSLAFTPSQPVTITRTVPVTYTIPPPSPLSETPGVTTAVTVSTLITVSDVITFAPQAIPLLVGALQEGNGYPYTVLRAGFTELPSHMAIGATWDAKNAQTTGMIVGRELAAVGVNLVLGPSLDVLREPRPDLSDNLGTRVFGGDPFWTASLGRAYVRGVHLGSGGRVATVAKHLPGLGASDRSLEEEVATVDKSFQDLRLVELPPFFGVTQTQVPTETTNALMTAHIRYRGFQGNIRYATRPISLDVQAMEQIMSLPELAAWRSGGGVLVSDSLGLPAIQRYYYREQDPFPHRQIALDAFQAGNDLLLLTRFSRTGDWDEQLANIEDTIRFFRGRYETDETFRQRVDASVRRILGLKRGLCPEFTLEGCAADGSALGVVGGSRATVARMAQEAITLLYPSPDELALRLPRPPRGDEAMVIFTEAREARDCEACPPFYLLDPQILRTTILQLYGPDATGQVSPERVTAFTFGQLRNYLEQSDGPDLGPFLREADWIVFAMLDHDPASDPNSTALKQFLREQAPSPEAQRIIVLAYDAPFYLDTTEVSKLTAYYGVYSRIRPFVETSVRALFLEFGPTGRSPVTVEGVGYDLVRQLSPDPAQTIEVLTDVPQAPEEIAAAEGTPQPLSLAVGGAIQVRTSVIVDRNGNPVPDGTPVIFQYLYQGEGLGGRLEAVTSSGVARATIPLEREGELRITATSDPAVNSRPVLVRLIGETAEILTPTPTPTPTPTSTPTPTPTPTDTPTATATPSPTPAPTATVAVVPPPPPEPRVYWSDLLFTLLGALGAGWVVYIVGGRILPTSSRRSVSAAVRLALWSGICALLGYLAYGLAMPGTAFLEGVAPGVRGLLIGLVCGLVPLIAAGAMAVGGRQIPPSITPTGTGGRDRV